MNFLQNIAHDLLTRFGSDLHNVAVIFPNKRASLFLSKYLAEQSDTPVWSPSYITISELFRQHSALTVDNQISLICRLYDIFVEVTGFQNETIDNFYGWGQLLLADFDDLDKNMAPADHVFSLVSDIHALDSADYLSEEQKAVLKHFFSSFTDDKTSIMQAKFLALWNNLYKIYTLYKESLHDNGLAYEGMLYRDVIESVQGSGFRVQGEEYHEPKTYCFVGFNMLQKCEQKLFSILREKALYYWDYSDFYLHDDHEAGHFIKQYLTLFPNALQGEAAKAPFVHSNPNSSLTYLSTPTENLQGRYVTKWLLEKERWKAGEKTAIVMADERLLQTVITALPYQVEKVNITTGYPLAETQASTLLSVLVELQREGRILGTGKYRQRQVQKVLNHPYGKYLCPDTDIFVDIDTIEVPEVAYTDQNLRLLTWLTQVMRHVAMQVEDSFESESLYRMYKALISISDIISKGVLKVDHNTLQRLLGQIINTTTIPFHGEPMEGIQIMGVLESRCLDFEHILLLSCNEGNMPKGEGDSSFIPHSVRQAYGLTTVENKVGIYSYYFHRLLQRSSDVTITYNSSTEGLNTGEMSRFMLQLKVECGGIREKALCAGQSSMTSQPHDIEKSSIVMSHITDMLSSDHAISPSSLSKYLRCPARYFYQQVAHLREVDDDTEDMDNRSFGNIFHKAAELVMRQLMDHNTHIVTKASLEALLKDRLHIERIVDRAFSEEFFKIKNPHERRPEYNGLQLIGRSVIIRLVRNLISYDIKYAPIKILLLEGWVDDTIEVTTADGEKRQMRIGGFIDRLDQITDPDTGKKVIRVVDYKTGAHMPKPIGSVEDVFKHEMVSTFHADYYLQTMLYSYIVSRSKKHNPDSLPVSPQLFYVHEMRKENFCPVLQIKGEPKPGKKTADNIPITDIREFGSEYIEHLQTMICEITDPTVPFNAYYDDKNCTAYCPFLALCKK